MNFTKDINEIIDKWLYELGIVNKLGNTDNVLEFLRWFILWIPKMPRVVHISKQLNESNNIEKKSLLSKKNLKKVKT